MRGGQAQRHWGGLGSSALGLLPTALFDGLSPREVGSLRWSFSCSTSQTHGLKDIYAILDIGGSQCKHGRASVNLVLGTGDVSEDPAYIDVDCKWDFKISILFKVSGGVKT